MPMLKGYLYESRGPLSIKSGGPCCVHIWLDGQLVDAFYGLKDKDRANRIAERAINKLIKNKRVPHIAS